MELNLQSLLGTSRTRRPRYRQAVADPDPSGIRIQTVGNIRIQAWLSQSPGSEDVMKKMLPVTKTFKFLFSETSISEVKLLKNDVKNRKFLLLRGRDSVCLT